MSTFLFLGGLAALAFLALRPLRPLQPAPVKVRASGRRRS